MKRFMLIAALAAVAYCWLGEGYNPLPPLPGAENHPAIAVASAGLSPSESVSFGRADNHHQVQGRGVVVRLLPDDNKGSRHQKFILKLPSGQTILVAHNIDLAPKITHLSLGDIIAFNGVYVWNEKGGVVHWTHHAPAGRHQSGWLKAAGRVYQ